MYSTDLTSISLGAFEETSLTIDLLPSRKVLAEEITDVVPELTGMGIDTLEDLRVLLRDKGRYPELAASLSVDERYLTVLNREVNSYVRIEVARTTDLEGSCRPDSGQVKAFELRLGEDVELGQGHRL